MSITVKFLMKQYAKYANQRPPLTSLLLLLLVDLIAFCHIQRGSCSSRLALVKVAAHKAKGADGFVEAPEAPEAPEASRQAGRHINRQLSNGQERNLWASSSVAGQDGVLLLQIGSA